MAGMLYKIAFERILDSVLIHGLIPKVPYMVTAKLADGKAFPFKFDSVALTTTEKAKTPEPVTHAVNQGQPSVTPDDGNPSDETGGMTTSASSNLGLQQGLLSMTAFMAYILM